MKIIAVDWSGKAKGPEESLWLAEVRDGKLTELRNGLDRGELIAKLVELGEAEPSTVIGLDFAFSFPAWWCEENGWLSGEDVWSAMAHGGEDLLDGCEPPFWGRGGKPNPIRKHGATGKPRSARMRYVRSPSFRSMATAPWAPDRFAGCRTC